VFYSANYTRKFNFKCFNIFDLINLMNKERFIEEAKLSNILNDNEQKIIQCVRCFQFSLSSR
jgi:hypothetical protein